MFQKKYYYLVHLQFLGFRYHGWQKQPGLKTIEGMLHKTLKYILPETTFKILGAGRTDAMVSAETAAFELFITNDELKDLEEFKTLFNHNLPADLRIISIETTDATFNIIQDVSEKEYIYLFSHETKNHPYAAPYIMNNNFSLDINAMKQAADLYNGTHNFKAFTVKAKTEAGASLVRTVKHCELKKNTFLTASFFPEESYALHVRGKGFMRYQIRMMMGALLQVGKGEMTLTELSDSLLENTTIQHTFVAPGSGLHLNSIEF